MDKALSSIRRYTKGDYINWEKDIFIEKKLVEKNCPIHWHDHYEIEYIVKGNGKQVLNGVEYPLSEGMLHFLTPTDFHELVVNEPLEIIKFNFREDNVEPFILSTLIGLCGNTSMTFSGEEKKVLETLLNMSLEHTKLFKNSAYYPHMIKKLLECILLNSIEHLGNLGTRHENGTSGGNIQKVLIYIHQHFKEPLELKKISAVVHYSPQHLSKLFHKTMGITFKEYVTNLRMNYASELLLNTQMEVAEISGEAGFGTRQNFTKEFKQFYSCSPSEYRQKNKKITRNFCE